MWQVTSALVPQFQPQRFMKKKESFKSPASTNPKLTDEGGPNVFRVCGRDDQQGEVAGKFLAGVYR